MVNITSVVAYGSFVASIIVLYLALSLALFLRGGKAWAFLWWFVGGAGAFAFHSIIFVLSSAEESPLDIASDGGHLAGLVLLAIGLWKARDFWERSGRAIK